MQKHQNPALARAHEVEGAEAKAFCEKPQSVLQLAVKYGLDSVSSGGKPAMAIRHLTATDQFIDFMASLPTLNEITTYAIAPETQARIQALLNANRSRRLTDAENVELDEYEHLGRMIRRAKFVPSRKWLKANQYRWIMTSIPERFRQEIRNTARRRCEYCLIDERVSENPHEIDHIVAEQHGGERAW